MTDLKPVTWREQKILTFVASFTRQNGYPPTRREIGDAVGLSSLSSVNWAIRRLELKGKLLRPPVARTSPSRAVTLVDDRERIAVLRDDLRVLLDALHPDMLPDDAADALGRLSATLTG